MFGNFLMNVFAGLCSNNFKRILVVFGLLNPKKEFESQNEKNSIVKTSPKLFNVLDVYIDLSEVLLKVKEPIAHLLVESKCHDSFYNQVMLVLESKVTGEWYVFGSRRMAAQGQGEGSRQLEITLNKLQQSKTVISLWAVSSSILHKLGSGLKPWPEIKSTILTLSVAIGNTQEDASLDLIRFPSSTGIAKMV